MISISTSQTFRSWVVIFHVRQHMAFLSLNLYDMPGLAPRMNVLFWGPGDFPVNHSNRDTSQNAWNRHSGSYDTGILFSNMKYPSHEWHSDPWPTVTSHPIWLSTNFMTLIPSLTSTDNEWFPWSICNGCGMPAGNAYPSGHLVPSPIVGLACAPIVETGFLDLAMSLLGFLPRIPLGIFLILLYASYFQTVHYFDVYAITKHKVIDSYQLSISGQDILAHSCSYKIQSHGDTRSCFHIFHTDWNTCTHNCSEGILRCSHYVTRDISNSLFKIFLYQYFK